MQKRIITGLLIGLLFLGIVVFVLGGIFSAKQSLTIRMYDSLQELCKLDEYCVEKYSLKNDPDVADIKVNDWYSGSFAYDGCTYKVFAYEFPDSGAAQTYFETVTGKHTQETWNYSCSGNSFFYTQFIVYYENRAYRVEGTSQKNCVDFINWLSSDFSNILLRN